MIGPTAQQIRSFAWLKRHLPKDGSVQLNDVTSMYTSINVIGPKARQLLTELTDTPLDKNNFPSMTYKVRRGQGLISYDKKLRLKLMISVTFILFNVVCLIQEIDVAQASQVT